MQQRRSRRTEEPAAVEQEGFGGLLCCSHSQIGLCKFQRLHPNAGQGDVRFGR